MIESRYCRTTALVFALLLILVRSPQGQLMHPVQAGPGATTGDLASAAVIARRLMGEGKFAEAESELQKRIAPHPDAPDLLYLLGEIQMRRNEAKQSLATMTKAAALRTPTGDQLRIVGLDYVLLGDTADALKWLKRAAALSPADAEIWYSLGRANYTAGQYAEAAACFGKTLEIDPVSAKAENNLGLALSATNQSEAALAAYRRAIALQKQHGPVSEQPLLNYGALQNHLGRPREASTALADAVAVVPGCAACHAEFGQSLGELGQIGEALQQLQVAVSLEKNNPRYHFQLGRLYKQHGDAERADQEMKLSATLYGTHATAVN